jgi:hypothetical protein
MMAIALSLSLAICALLALTPYAAAECLSFGVDFVDGGSYFINTGSPDLFNFTSFFRGMHHPLLLGAVELTSH